MPRNLLVYLARKNLLQLKEKWVEPFHYGAAIAFFLSLFRLYLNEQPLNEESFINLIEELF
jgi:hypothetical protein